MLYAHTLTGNNIMTTGNKTELFITTPVSGMYLAAGEHFNFV